jgi:hypothetical protein
MWQPRQLDKQAELPFRLADKKGHGPGRVASGYVENADDITENA